MTETMIFLFGFVCGLLFVVLWFGLGLFYVAKTTAKNKRKQPPSLAVMVPTKPDVH